MRCLVPLFILICITIAQISPAAGTTPIASSGAEDLGNNRYKLGEIIIDKNTNSIKFPAKVNMQEGLIELFLCAPYGKTHESLLVTDVNGINLNLALILIGCKEGDIKVKEQGQDVIPQGTLVTIEIEFKDDDEKVKRVRAEDWIYNDKLKAAMPHTNWVYTGSFIHEGEYMAKATGTYIVTFHDPYTIIDLPLKEGADDTVYWVNKDAAKKKAHPVTVIITRVKEDDENKKEDDSNDAKTEEGAGDGQTKSDDRSGDIVVDLTADGSVLVQGEEHDLDSLVDVIGAIVEEKGPDNVHVILGADKTLRYQKVIDAIAVIRDAGCSNVSFAAQRKDHENGSATDDGPAEPDKDRMSLLVNVRENGEITISGKKYDIDAMKTLITDLKKKTGKDGFPVYLRADKDLEYGRVEEIIKAIEETGCHDISFVVTPEKEGLSSEVTLKGPERLAVGITKDGGFVFADRGYDDRSLVEVISPIIKEKGAGNVFVTLYSEEDVEIEDGYATSAVNALEKPGCKRENIKFKAPRLQDDL